MKTTVGGVGSTGTRNPPDTTARGAHLCGRAREASLHTTGPTSDAVAPSGAPGPICAPTPSKESRSGPYVMGVCDRPWSKIGYPPTNRPMVAREKPHYEPLTGRTWTRHSNQTTGIFPSRTCMKKSPTTMTKLDTKSKTVKTSKPNVRMGSDR